MSPAATPLRILLVDDSVPDQELLGEALRLTGVPMELLPVSSGAAALDQALESIDLVVLALHLPGMSGFDVLKQLRADLRTCQLPVLVMGAASAAEVREAFGLQADEVLSRGANFAAVQRLAERIVHFVGGVQARMLG